MIISKVRSNLPKIAALFFCSTFVAQVACAGWCDLREIIWALTSPQFDLLSKKLPRQTIATIDRMIVRLDSELNSRKFGGPVRQYERYIIDRVGTTVGNAAEIEIVARLSDMESFKNYFRTLLKDAALAMISDGGKQATLAETGHISLSGLEKALVARGKRYGLRPIYLNEVLSGEEFGKAIASKKLIIEPRFQGTPHGVLSHAIQITYLYPYLKTRLGSTKRIDEFFHLLGSADSGPERHYWTEYFDSGKGNLSQPEIIQNLMDSIGIIND